MNVIDISRIDRTMADRVGGKAAGLGELAAAGERVPTGFCVTVDAYRSGRLPEQEIVAACRALGDGPVAVRSSATAEDQPDASFAGQQDTYLNVHGTDAVLRAIRDCWASLRTERAIAYRADQRIAEDGLAMAVVVQRMVDARVAGVLFTANPLSGCRTESVVDAAEGPGTAVVDGSVVADHYVLDGTGSVTRSTGADPDRTTVGCLGADQLAELWRAGQRLQHHFGTPQDIEWAIDADDVLWVLQSRPITTLFPLPPDQPAGRASEPRAYLEAGHLQGMLRPITPMGMSMLERTAAGWADAHGIRIAPAGRTPLTVDIGGRLFMDLTGVLRSSMMRQRMTTSMRMYGPRVSAAYQRLLADSRFAPRKGAQFPILTMARIVAQLAPPALASIVTSLARPVRTRERVLRGVADLAENPPTPPAGMSTEERLRWASYAQVPFMGKDMAGVLWPLMTGLLVQQLPGRLLSGLATEDEFTRIHGGLPHNVTTEMDIALWRIADSAREHSELLLDTPAEELAERYRAGTLPELGLTTFLAKYGHRTAAEIDIGVPRWAEDPTPLFSTIANYLRIADPAQSPERRFEHAAAEAEVTIAELARRSRRRPIRGSLARLFMRRTRQLAGLREIGKFAWLYVLEAIRAQLLRVGADLVARDLLDQPDDIMFLDLDEAHRAVEGTDQRALVAERRGTYQRELKRRRVPVMLLSDGTDVETLLEPDRDTAGMPPGTLTGMATSPGTVTARARVIQDPTGARLDPGEILVARTTDPGWTPLFMSAGGLVTETGALVAHGPTVAREYGLPAVICVRDATTAISTGQRITVDGTAGTVRLEDD